MGRVWVGSAVRETALIFLETALLHSYESLD
jgi:hypothetical protein